MSYEGPQAPPSDEYLVQIEQRLTDLNQALLALMAAAAPKLLADVADDPVAGREIEAVVEAIRHIQARVAADAARDTAAAPPDPPPAVAIADTTAPTSPPTAGAAPVPAGSWRDAVPPELFERMRERSSASPPAPPAVDPTPRQDAPAGGRGAVPN